MYLQPIEDLSPGTLLTLVNRPVHIRVDERNGTDESNRIEVVGTVISIQYAASKSTVMVTLEDGPSQSTSVSWDTDQFIGRFTTDGE